MGEPPGRQRQHWRTENAVQHTRETSHFPSANKEMNILRQGSFTIALRVRSVKPTYTYRSFERMCILRSRGLDGPGMSTYANAIGMSSPIQLRPACYLSWQESVADTLQHQLGLTCYGTYNCVFLY